MVELSKEFSRIEPVVVLLKNINARRRKRAAEELIKDDDSGI